MPTGEQLIQDLLSPFATAMDEQGLTIKFLAKKLKSELNAHKIDTFKAKTTRKEMKTDEVVIETEEVLYSKPMVDWKTRQEARKDALAYRSIFVAQRVKMEHSGSINYSEMSDEELDERIKEGFKTVFSEDTHDQD